MSRPDPEGRFDDTPAGDFKSFASQRPSAPPGFDLIEGSQKVYLRSVETSDYININASGWAYTDNSKLTQYVLVQYYVVHYIVIANGSYKNYYLSYNRNSYVGGYSGWRNACYWAADPVDCSPYPGLYPYGNSTETCNYLCCNGVADAIDKLITVVAF